MSGHDDSIGQLATRGFGLYDEGRAFAFEAWPTQLSYYWGGTDDGPLRVEVGRFFHDEFSELGLIDSAELVYRNGRGDRMGASLGFLPEPFPNLQTGREFQASVFYRVLLDETGDVTAGIAFQRTWHDWIPDRDLVVANFDYTPSSKVSLHAAVGGDFYDSNDNLKSTAFEVTQSHISGVYRINTRTGIGANVTDLRWPQLLRNDFRPVLEELIQRNRVFRGGVYQPVEKRVPRLCQPCRRWNTYWFLALPRRQWHTWWSISTGYYSRREVRDHIRLDARVDQWFDQDDSGTAWDFGITFQEWPDPETELFVGIYDTDGLYRSTFPFPPCGRQRGRLQLLLGLGVQERAS